jgi:hypothetical protein
MAQRTQCCAQEPPAAQATLKAPYPSLGAEELPVLFQRMEKAGDHDCPAEQQVLVELLNQQSPRANAIDRLQQQGQQQLFRWGRGSAALGIEPTEVGVETI